MSKKNLKFGAFALAAIALSAFVGACCPGTCEEKQDASACAKKSNVPVTVAEEENAVTVGGSNFSARFSKTTGTLESLVYGGKNIIADGNGPKLNAFRAIVNNDGWAYGKWFQNGLFDLRHEVVGAPVVSANADGTATLSFVVKSRGKNAGALKGDPLVQYGNPVNGVPVKIELGSPLTDDALTFTTHQIWTVYPDGSVELAANITSNQPNFDLPRLGFTLDVPAEFNAFTYYGRGPQENYNDRESGAFVGIFKSTVAEQLTPYTKPQEAGNHEDVRWCALENADGDGAIFIAGENGFSAAALPVSAADLIFAPNPFWLDEKIANAKTTKLTLDAGVRGLGGASCGPDTEKRDKIFAAPTDFGLIIRPISAGKDLRELANVAPAGAVPIAITRNAAGAVSVLSKKHDAEIRVSVNGGKDEKYAGTIPFKNGGKISAWFAGTPNIKTEYSFPKLDKIRTAVLFASSENSGNEAATNLTDNDPATIWHTTYSVTAADYPHWVDFDVGEVKKLKGVSYLPRQDGSGNGDVKAYEIFVSGDAHNWTKVASGVFSGDKAEKKVLFATPTDARYVRFRALSSQNGQIHASGAEFSVLEN